MDIRYISEPEKVEAERKAKEGAAEAERKALAKRETAREKARLKAEEKKRKEDKKNALFGRSSFSLSMTSKAVRARLIAPIIQLDPARPGKVISAFMKASTHYTSLVGQTSIGLLWLVTSIICVIMAVCLRW